MIASTLNYRFYAFVPVNNESLSKEIYEQLELSIMLFYNKNGILH